ncbi:MAG TPA: hypothetical protein ENL03_03800 [Phycisphaerae bacterium]|nr:hypothetical protein [Phycisphaerae bacterium]
MKVIVNDAKAVAAKVTSRIRKKDSHWSNYCLDLSLEAMLEYGAVSGEKEYIDYVQSVMTRRKWKPEKVIRYKGQPFCHVNYTFALVTQNDAYLKPFVSESEQFYKEVPKSVDGLALHRNKSVENGAIIIDFIQDYASRMAQTGKLTGEEKYYDECMEQFRLYRKVLRNSKTGLWSNGRGWLEDTSKLSPGAWSRGHGWLIRGMVDSLCALPEDSKHHRELAGYLLELSDALIEVQDEDGMWNQLLHRPFADSYADASGTGLICYNFCKAIAHGYLPREKYQKSALKAFAGLQKKVTDEGIILNVCPGPGPLRDEQEYVNNPGYTEDATGHGPMAVIFACTGILMISK